LEVVFLGFALTTSKKNVWFLHHKFCLVQPMTNEMYNAYILQHQQQQQQQYQQYQLQQEHHQSFTMAAGPSPP